MQNAARFMVLAWLASLAGCSSASAVDGYDVPDARTEAAAADGGSEASVEAAAEASDGDLPEDAQDAAEGGTVQPLGCITAVSAGHHRFACKGIDYDVEIPPQCTAGACGLVLEIHGMTMNADQQDKNTGMRALGIQHGYVVVQPTAPMTTMGPSWTPVIDDNRVWGFLQDARTALAIDPKRIHVAGFSQGGAMTWRMVCAHADVLASAAPVAAADGSSWTVMPPYILDCPFTLASSPPVQLPILHMHGTADAVVPFGKGEQQRDALLARWEMNEKEIVSTNGQHTWKRYVNASGTVYEFVQHDWVTTTPLVPVVFGGHCMPGSPDLNTNPSPGETMFFGCAPPNAVTWGAAVMQFFVDHPKS
jgi:poly(3-hydroxybutyrate) depolymerase